jgi:hypothetical protein
MTCSVYGEFVIARVRRTGVESVHAEGFGAVKDYGYWSRSDDGGIGCWWSQKINKCS